MKKSTTIPAILLCLVAPLFVLGQSATNLIVTPTSPVQVVAPVTISTFTVSTVTLDYVGNTITVAYVGIPQKTVFAGGTASGVINAFSAANAAALKSYISANPPQ